MLGLLLNSEIKGTGFSKTSAKSHRTRRVVSNKTEFFEVQVDCENTILKMGQWQNWLWVIPSGGFWYLLCRTVKWAHFYLSMASPQVGDVRDGRKLYKIAG
jgi:hypothetical protein